MSHVFLSYTHILFPRSNHNPRIMKTLCTIMEYVDENMQIAYSKEEEEQSSDIRKRYYKWIANDKLDEIRNAKSEEVQAILKTL